jgi:hypothetical protein
MRLFWKKSLDGLNIDRSSSFSSSSSCRGALSAPKPNVKYLNIKIAWENRSFLWPIGFFGDFGLVGGVLGAGCAAPTVSGVMFGIRFVRSLWESPALKFLILVV